MKNDTIVFDVTPGSEFLLQLMCELLQIDTITDGVVRLHGGHKPPRMMSLETNHEVS